MHLFSGVVTSPESSDEKILRKTLTKPTRQLNILLLGETGVGKSTWINGFANYLSYATLEEARLNDGITLIASSFSLQDNAFREVDIHTGEDDNEIQEVGQSSTQLPQTYSFLATEGIAVRLIDTPGIGDTRGIETDKVNMQSILNHIADFEELHGICILLKPNNARLGVMFQFCIRELLTHLHRSACQNIVFCFTNSRCTFFRPGDTLPALKKLLSDDENDAFRNLNKDMIYCFDNEAVRYLYAVRRASRSPTRRRMTTKQATIDR